MPSGLSMVAHAHTGQRPARCSPLARAEPDILVTVCRRTRAWQARPARLVDRGATMEPCGDLCIERNTSGRKGGPYAQRNGQHLVAVSSYD